MWAPSCCSRPVLGCQRVNEFAAEDRGFGPAPRLLGGGSEMVPGSVRFRVGMAVDPVQVSDESVEEGGGPLRVPGSAGEGSVATAGLQRGGMVSPVDGGELAEEGTDPLRCCSGLPRCSETFCFHPALLEPSHLGLPRR